MSGLKKEDWIILVIAALAVIVMIFSLTPGNKAVGIESGNGYETRVSSGLVAIELTPVDFKDGKMYVNAKVDTHAGELGDYDLVRLVTLEYNGKSLNPSSAGKLSGHHSSSMMTFDTGKEPKSFRITIRRIPDQPERVMEWQ